MADVNGGNKSNGTNGASHKEVSVWLWKRGTLRSNWKRRFFVLGDKHLDYYENENDYHRKKPRGHVTMIGALVSPLQADDARSMKNKFTFSITPRTTSKILIVATDTSSERDHWVSLLSEYEKQISRVDPSSNRHTLTSAFQESICNGCHKSFGLTRRRHMCKNCGRQFCSPCSSHRIHLPELEELSSGMHRVCDNCFHQLTTAKDTPPTKSRGDMKKAPDQDDGDMSMSSMSKDPIGSNFVSRVNDSHVSEAASASASVSQSIRSRDGSMPDPYHSSSAHDNNNNNNNNNNQNGNHDSNSRESANFDTNKENHNNHTNGLNLGSGNKFVKFSEPSSVNDRDDRHDSDNGHENYHNGHSNGILNHGNGLMESENEGSDKMDHLSVRQNHSKSNGSEDIRPGNVTVIVTNSDENSHSNSGMLSVSPNSKSSKSSSVSTFPAASQSQPSSSFSPPSASRVADGPSFVNRDSISLYNITPSNDHRSRHAATSSASNLDTAAGPMTSKKKRKIFWCCA